MRLRSLMRLCLTLAATALSGCVFMLPSPPKPLTPEEIAQRNAKAAAFQQEERQLYGNGGEIPRGVQPYNRNLSNYAEYRGPNTVGSERMAQVTQPYRYVQIYVKNGATADQIRRKGSYAAQVRDVFIYPMTLRASRRYTTELDAIVARLCPPVRDHRPADSVTATSNDEIDEFLEGKLGSDGGQIWRYFSPSVPSCRLMDFGG